MKKRIWAMTLAVVLALSLVPVSAVVPRENAVEWVEAEGIEGGKVLFNSETGEIEDCEATVTSANVPTSINDRTVSSIGYSAFEDCVALKTAHIPSSVERIRGAAFQGCVSLETVEISASIKSLEGFTFAGCDSLIHITIPESITSIGQSAFRGCINLMNLEIPDKVTSIGSGAFFGCESLEGTLKVPDGVKKIESETFAGCRSVTAISIPKSVQIIGSMAFHSCMSLTALEIPDGVLSIGEGAFTQCNNLTSVIIPDSLINVGKFVFQRCTKLMDLYYAGTEEQWKNLTSGLGDLLPEKTMVHVNATGPDNPGNTLTKPTKTYTVNIQVDGCGTISGNGTYQEGALITVIATPSEGYDFNYWSENGIVRSYQEKYEFEVTGDIVLVAHFREKKVEHTITFATNGGSKINDLTVSAGTTVDLTKYIPIKEGYTFAGWYSDSKLTTAVTSLKLTGDTTVYAKWTPAEYTLTFATNGGSKINDLPVSAGTTVDLTKYIPTKEGYTFAGWYSDSKLTTAVTSLKLTADTTVYAKWIPAEYTLTFATNGGSKINDLPVSAGTTVDLTKYIPIKEGYTFAGWYSDSKLTTAVTSLKLTGDTTVYAKWTPAEYTLTFATNGGSKINDLPVSMDTTVDLRQYVPVREGYDFVGWYADRKLTTPVTVLQLTEDTIVYAKWEETSVTLPFYDVASDDWFYEDVAYVYENGLMNGMGEGQFGPQGTTTRGMIVTILYRQAGSPAASGNPFTDVDPGQYYAEPIAWAASHGIVNGISATTFAPDAPITREQMATILYRYAQYQGEDVSDQGNLSAFADADTISAYAKQAMAWANGAGLINGVEGNRLNPTGQAVRCQAAAILHRFCTQV